MNINYELLQFYVYRKLLKKKEADDIFEESKNLGIPVREYLLTKEYIFMHAYRNWYYGYVAHYPSISIDGLNVVDIETRKPVPAGYEVLINGQSLIDEPAMHLPETVSTHPLYPCVDDDGDGLVDGTSVPYDPSNINRSGVMAEDSYKNLNMIAPPKYFRLYGNENASEEGKARILVYDTANYKNISEGGFFGKTEFATDGATYLGTDYVGRDTETFKFIDMEDFKNDR